VSNKPAPGAAIKQDAQSQCKTEAALPRSPRANFARQPGRLRPLSGADARHDEMSLREIIPAPVTALRAAVTALFRQTRCGRVDALEHCEVAVAQLKSCQTARGVGLLEETLDCGVGAARLSDGR